MTQSVGNFPFPRSSFEWPVIPPDSEADEGEIAVVCFSYAWLPYVLGALKQLLLQSTWDGDNDAVELALGRATDLIAQFDSPSALCPEIMVLRGVRYNSDTDTVQTDFGGTGTWTDAPGLDPRHSEAMMFPPLTTDDPRCDAAANMRVNLKAFVDAGIRYAELATLTATLIDALLLFIPGIPTILEIVLAGAAALLTAGADALTDDFTTAVYDGIQCIFYCHASGTGVISPDELENIRADIQLQYPGVVYDVCLAYLLITGEVGLTNAGASGSETGDCSSCDCGSDGCVDFRTGLHGWSILNDGTANARGVQEAGIGVATTGTGDSADEVYVYYRFSAVRMTRITIHGHHFMSGSPHGVLDLLSGGTVIAHVPFNPYGTDGEPNDYALTWTGDETPDGINLTVTEPGGGAFQYLKFHFTDDTPASWTDTCP